jgi:hypothetical protein
MQEMQRRTTAMQQANEAELAATLGNKYPKWEEYQSSLQVRQQVSQLKNSLGTSGSTLSDAQSQQLITALAAEQKRINQETRNNPMSGRNQQEILEQQLERTVDSNRRLVDVASGYLNPQQLESYRRQLELQERLQRTILGTMGGAGNTQ